MRVGIIGSGIAGLYAAHRFSRAGAAVTIFERQPGVGMGAHTLDLPGGLRGDVPSRMFNPQLWPMLYGLYAELGIEVVAVDPGQTFFDPSGDVYLTLEESYRPWNRISSLLSARSRRILLEANRLRQKGPASIEQLVPGTTFSEYRRQEGYSDDFIFGFLYPTLSSTVCTCSYRALDNYPADLLLTVLQRLTGSGIETEGPILLRTAGGTREVERRLLPSGSEVRTGVSVQRIRRLSESVEVEVEGRALEFDHVILATQANTALRLITDLRREEREMLDSVDYESVYIGLHSDTSWMPAKRNRWRTFNMGVRRGPTPSAFCSVWMNRFHEWDSEEDLFQTISSDPIQAIDGKNIRLQRPVVTAASDWTWSRLGSIHVERDRRLWFAGSWAHAGLPLLESGVASVAGLPLLNDLLV